MKNSKERILIVSAWISFAVSIIVLGIKFFAYFTTHSQAVLSDALESIINVVASFIALLIIKKVSQPADEDHPYGHGKLEYFSAAFEGGLIFFAALLIIFGSTQSLFAGSKLKEIDSGIALMVLSTIINFFLALQLYSVGKSKKSEALLASSKHIFSDVYTTIGVVVGLGLVKFTGIIWIDDVVAILVAIHLLFEGYKIARGAIGGLIDEVDQDSLSEFAKLFTKLRSPGMIDIHQMKLIRSGRFHHIDAHLVVPEFWNVAEAHEINDEFENALIDAYPYDCEVAFHLDPCGQNYCQVCDLKNCNIRNEQFKGLIQYSARTLIRTPEILVKGSK